MEIIRCVLLIVETRNVGDVCGIKLSDEVYANYFPSDALKRSPNTARTLKSSSTLGIFRYAQFCLYIFCLVGFFFLGGNAPGVV